MEEDFKFSRDYIADWKRAKQIGSITELDQIFRSVMSEIGISDPQSDQAQREAGKAAALLLNARDKGTGGKKI